MQDNKDAEEILIEDVKAGREGSFDRLVLIYSERAFSVAYGFTRNAEEAKDISQEAFIKVYENIKSYRGSSKFFTWFYRIIMNLCIDHSRKKKLMNVVSIFKRKDSAGEGSAGELILKAGEKDNPENILLNSDRGKKIMESLSSLTVREKGVFELKHYQGLKIREIAEVMKIREGTVKMLLFRAVNKLKNKLEGENI